MDLAGKLNLESKVERRVFHRCPQCNSEWPASAEYCRRCVVWLGSTPMTEEISWYGPADPFSPGPGGLPGGVYEATVVTVAACRSAYETTSGIIPLLIKAAGQILDLGGMLARGPGGHLAGCFLGKNLMEAAERAVQCGLAVKSECEKSGLKIFIGINTGPALVKTNGPGGKAQILGEVIACSEAVALSLHPGMVILSPASFRLVATHFDCYGTPPADLWGKHQEAPKTVYLVTGVKRATSWRHRLDDPSGPFFGRKEELGLLRRYWGETTLGERPEGWNVHLVGEAGSGKSKLLQAFLAGLKQDDSQATVIKLAGSNYGGEPGLLLQEFMAECVQAGILPGKEAQKMPPAKDQTFQPRLPGTLAARVRLVSQLALDLGSHGPALILIDDVHWADRASILAFGKAWATLPANIMLVASYRPSGAKLAKLLMAADTKRIFLGPLSEKEAKQVSQFHEAEGKAFSPSLWRQIWENSEGNPLYVEEATKYILDRGDVSVEDRMLPRSREGLILARIKAWADQELGELQRGLGLRWIGSLQSRLSGFEMQINDWLDRLETQRYLERAELAECLEELERFQGRIVELCLVGGLPRSLTTRLGEALSRLYEGSYGDHYRHLLRSSRAAENHSWVGNQALQAGKRAIDGGRLREGVRFLRLAEKMLPSDDPLRMDLLEKAGDANLMLGRAGEAARLFEKAIKQEGIGGPHDGLAHKLLAARIFNGEPLDREFCSGRKEVCPWHLIGMSLRALLAKKNREAASIAEEGRAVSPDWVTQSSAGLVAALAQLALGNRADALARCADLSQGMREGGLSVLSLGLHWVLSQVTEGPARRRHARLCRLIGKQLGVAPGWQAFLTRLDFQKGNGRTRPQVAPMEKRPPEAGNLFPSGECGAIDSLDAEV